jgi:hypothetical protein
MDTVDVKAVVKKETTPTEDGTRLAAYVLKQKYALQGLTLDVRELAPEDLVSSFVNAFLHTLQGAGVDIRVARKITWRARFPSEKDRLRQLVDLYVDDAVTEAPAR